jgi:hypothetical protein
VELVVKRLVFALLIGMLTTIAIGTIILVAGGGGRAPDLFHALVRTVLFGFVVSYLGRQYRERRP